MPFVQKKKKKPFTLFWPILGHFFGSEVTLVTLGSNLKKKKKLCPKKLKPQTKKKSKNSSNLKQSKTNSNNLKRIKNLFLKNP